ncbi:GtrA family protein [Saccharomonospora viridis]|jgi:putative flippase GtrA|uniref:Predicted membrane protein n=2 Tax=Saccharomonospora viridis TaxID=1852 RepID=C7MSB6_SACVD|nr:GtrA family protein [Saccharomonospora viridis]ACU95229.1 predicted membrane protein [Saccharomonospora viridis DSM 43017]KHF44864.1 polysaccharide synthesis protein GtrA [Saccharomonospora viridis]SFP19101.1 Putative flippase GtrA (transmembrane translocase of bactoprenol-linked glucose) [Saccharomonospora viridis]
MVATDSQASEVESASHAPSPGLLAQILRFVLIGGFCALVDSGLYWLLLQAGAWVHLAKAISFIAGTTTAYFLNRRFTFTAAQKGGAGQLGGFMLLYTVTFFVNVGTNALALHLLPELGWRIALAWIIAQGTATTINFIMLKWVVFREPRG